MFFTAATVPGSADKPNEDWVAVSPEAAVVLDGVTVFRETETGCRHGTPWYVRRLGARLLSTAAEFTVPLEQVLERAIEDVAKMHADTCDLDQVGAPSAAVALTRFNERTADYLVLADVTVMFEGTSGLSIITDDRVSHSVQDLEGQKNVGSRIMERRAQYRNQEGGYWVAAADPNVAKHAITRTAPMSEIHRMALMSDGVTRLITQFRQDDWAGLLQLASAENVQSVIERVRMFENSDSGKTRWPRFKVSDDATMALLNFR